MALMAHPDANASYTDKGVAQHKSAHVSVAVAIAGGLITPVVRDAQSKGLAQIAAEMKDLAARAREKKLKPQEYMGGTFSISNLGMMGIRQFASIINPPEDDPLCWRRREARGGEGRQGCCRDDDDRDVDVRPPRGGRRDGRTVARELQAVR